MGHDESGTELHINKELKFEVGFEEYLQYVNGAPSWLL